MAVPLGLVYSLEIWHRKNKRELPCSLNLKAISIYLITFYTRTMYHRKVLTRVFSDLMILNSDCTNCVQYIAKLI